MKFLSPDSGLMRGWNNLTDGVWINILMLVTSIPLVTVGAALTAGHDAARKTLAGEGHVTTNYFRSFKSNFVKSTVQCGAGSAVLRVGRSADCTVANSKIRFHHRMDHGLRMGLGVTGSFRK